MLTLILNAIVKALTLGAFKFADGQIVRRKIEQGAVAKNELRKINDVLDTVAAAESAVVAGTVRSDANADRMLNDPRNRGIPGGGEEL